MKVSRIRIRFEVCLEVSVVEEKEIVNLIILILF